MKVSSELKNVRVVSDEIIDYVKKARPNIDTDILFDIKLCVEETVRNAIVHGNKSNKNLPVDITYVIDEDRIRISIEDKGEGFDVNSLPDPTNPKNLYKESGRGVYLIHKLMDKVSYNDKGNHVTIEKKLEG